MRQVRQEYRGFLPRPLFQNVSLPSHSISFHFLSCYVMLCHVMSSIDFSALFFYSTLFSFPLPCPALPSSILFCSALLSPVLLCLYLFYCDVWCDLVWCTCCPVVCWCGVAWCYRMYMLYHFPPFFRSHLYSCFILFLSPPRSLVYLLPFSSVVKFFSSSHLHSLFFPSISSSSQSLSTASCEFRHDIELTNSNDSIRVNLFHYLHASHPAICFF